MKRKYVVLLLGLATSGLWCQVEQAPVAPISDTMAAPAAKPMTAAEVKFGVAVLDLELQGLEAIAGKALSDRLRSDLVATGRFTVMERGQMDEIMKEQGFQASGACSDEACLIEIGQLLGVEKMVAGSLGKLGKLYLVNLRTIDIRTGKIEQTVSQDCTCEVENLPLAITIVAKKLAGDDVSQNLKDLKAIEDQAKKDKEKEQAAKATPIAPVEVKKEGPSVGAVITAVALLGGAGGLVYYLVTKKEDKPPVDTIEPASGKLPDPILPPGIN
ncbi:MAG: hypothetical protein A2268_12565 [Candidatus Raymondbacteria bacterium RifOxyA12_full_50_37]|uniref:FlgO domain-containing protein n=1 Tax=Candidatus Raymondbacteria bacterium RIFOXYD12_FULL_49_13 TaxID=1817890 RepID=A0A1F7FB24_UNCRA|nr:MAG: hypothetical protein A2268_12565 [Candidatus Raymondbacteria bacterium RifOxyA12_full_50_37]OGJ91009.1 MAG: hypothetical protein A2248_00585 [Candidatus Raymondbacteria bacterium RIFOXYA2_FULL_49_16]OGJ97446.1 MAG: hypothetical protein A2453_10135 [Candidatus Raymondbacteria bacterium RIFOXYC2_FULL_50_21]OGK03875.1 MAG: hypothetical protein A2519_00515 [Candidatus Raymondbacteria bacterium RIFOXYD12_FULL_49_13]OGP43580.1 MAG: hypothetical protein A2324_13140 [Candidatus Raymondbacteria 